MTPLLLFDTTHHAMWAEQVVLGAGFAAEIQPAPADARAKCSLALALIAEEESAVHATLEAAGVPFKVYAPGR